MSMETFILTANLSMASTLVIVFFGLAKLHSIGTNLKVIWVLAGVSFICDMAALNHAQLKINNNYASDAYLLVEFVLLQIIYFRAFKNPNVFRIFRIIAFIYIVFFFFNVLFVQREKINSYTYIISAGVFVVLAVLFFYKLMNDLPTVGVYRLPMFWVSVAVLVYFSGNIFVFTLSDYLVTVLKDNLIVYWSFHNFLAIVKNILLAIGFLLEYKSTGNFFVILPFFLVNCPQMICHETRIR